MIELTSAAWRFEGASRLPLKLPAGQLPSTQARLRDPRGGCLKADTSEAQRRRDGVHRASGRAQPAPHGQSRGTGRAWVAARTGPGSGKPCQGPQRGIGRRIPRAPPAPWPTLRTGQGEDNTGLSALCSLCPSPRARAEPSPPPPVAARPQRAGWSAWTD